MINYNIGESQMITTCKISDLFKSHKNILYKDSLNFNTYKDKNIDEKGKAYLKWYIPGVGKERNITKIKELMKDNELSKKANSNIYNLIKEYKSPYFISLSVFIGIIISLITIFLSVKFKTNCGMIISFILLFLSLLLFLSGAMNSILCPSFFLN